METPLRSGQHRRSRGQRLRLCLPIGSFGNFLHFQEVDISTRLCYSKYSVPLEGAYIDPALYQ